MGTNNLTQAATVVGQGRWVPAHRKYQEEARKAGDMEVGGYPTALASCRPLNDSFFRH